jgi:GTPase SAR1 family protein
MINRRNSPINSLETIIDSTLSILQECKKIPQMYDSSFDEHQKTCHRILEDIHSNRLKIAVAGTIKSGKSTFINSLVGKDLVKRGAGVVTSITTRIRKGKKNRANIYFKSWDAINIQLQKAIDLFQYDGAGIA